MRIYVASSWRNAQQPEVVKLLREAGHEVYDFRNPDGWEEDVLNSWEEDDVDDDVDDGSEDSPTHGGFSEPGEDPDLLDTVEDDEP